MFHLLVSLSIPFYQRVDLSTRTTSNTQANTSQENIAGERVLVPNSEFYTDIVYISRVQATKSECMIPVGIHTLFYYMGFMLRRFVVVRKQISKRQKEGGGE